MADDGFTGAFSRDFNQPPQRRGQGIERLSRRYRASLLQAAGDGQREKKHPPAPPPRNHELESQPIQKGSDHPNVMAHAPDAGPVPVPPDIIFFILFRGKDLRF